MIEKAIKMYFEDIKNYSEIMRACKCSYPVLKCLFDEHKERLRYDPWEWSQYKKRVLKLGYKVGRVWDED